MQSKLSAKRALPIIRVFVSSTFSDLKHERNALHAQVWPALEHYCQQRAEAGLDHRTMRSVLSARISIDCRVGSQSGSLNLFGYRIIVANNALQLTMGDCEWYFYELFPQLLTF
jgi:hypothetical protein